MLILYSSTSSERKERRSVLRENGYVDGAHTVLVDDGEWRTCYRPRGDAMRTHRTTFLTHVPFPRYPDLSETTQLELSQPSFPTPVEYRHRKAHPASFRRWWDDRASLLVCRSFFLFQVLLGSSRVCGCCVDTTPEQVYVPHGHRSVSNSRLTASGTPREVTRRVFHAVGGG